MKRTFWFGMIWTLAVVPYIASVILTLLVVGFPGINDYIMLKSDYDAYKVLATLVVNDAFIYVLMAIPVVSAILLLWLAWWMRFITKERLKFWNIVREYPKTHPGGNWGMAGRCALIIAVVAGGYMFCEKVQPVEIGAMFMVLTSYSGPYPVVAFFTAMLSLRLPVTFTVATFSYAIATSATLKDFYRKVAVSVAGLLCVGLLYAGVQYAQGLIDLDKTLDRLPGLSYEKQPRGLLVLTRPYEMVEFADLYHDRDLVFNEDVLPYNKENAQAIEAYLADKGAYAALRGTAYNYEINYHTRLLELGKVRALRLEAFRRTGHFIQAAMGISSIYAGPATSANLAIVDGYCDEDEMSVRGKTALRLSGLYAKFGEIDKARYWYEKGIRTGERIYKTDNERYEPPKTPPFHNCRITGVLILNGRPWPDAHVGIIKAVSAKSYLEYPRASESKDYQFTYLNSIADGTTTDASGRFTFDHLGEEEYVLLLSVDTSGGKKYRVLNSPGPLKVSEKSPSADAGTINVVTE